MLNSILAAFWFFLPAGLANTAPVFASKIPFLSKYNHPADNFWKINGKRVLGDHKTIRGFISAIVVGISVVAVQKYLALGLFSDLAFQLDYQYTDPIILGFLLSFGALFGDAVKSFFKRQVGIEPGRAWFPFDQLDYIVGGILFSMIYVQLDLVSYVWIALVYFLLHILSTVAGYFLKLKTSPI